MHARWVAGRPATRNGRRTSRASKTCGRIAAADSARRARGCSASTASPTRCTRPWCCACEPMARSCVPTHRPTRPRCSPTGTCATGWRPRQRSAGPSKRPRSAAEDKKLELRMKNRLSLVACALGFVLPALGADASHTFSAADLNSLARVADPQVSPDGRYVVYVQRETDLEANRGRNDLWLLDLETQNLRPRKLTQHSANDTHP